VFVLLFYLIPFSFFFLNIVLLFILLANALNDRLYKRFSELSRLATNSECIDQLMDLLRMQNSMDEILTLISQATSPQVHARLAELLHTLLNVSTFALFFLNESFYNTLQNKSHILFDFYCVHNFPRALS
jgi:hypothetical protein